MERRPLEKLLDMSSIEVPGELSGSYMCSVLPISYQIPRRRLA